ncbi:MAG: septum formation initiator family protein [Candidatus Zambryskibacteria bacterium]|nr:septum formation initiator family protein [Candidatus Zambryskibacteria bacterium]
MKELQRRQRVKRILYSYPSLIVMAVICFFLVRGAVGVMLKERASANKVEELEAQSEALESREAELNSEIARLETPEGIVEEIRDKFSVTREGEYVAIIVDDRPKATTTEKSASERFKEWWEKLMRIFSRNSNTTN